MESPRSLRCLVVTQEIWEHVLLHKSTAIAQHLPGKENVIADQQSRVFSDSSKWRLDPQVFAALRSLFPLIQVDLFADRLDHQLARYWSWRPGPHAEGVDALTTVWNSMSAYAFLLFRLVHRILRKVQDERSELLLVAPVSSPVTDVNRSTCSDTNVSRSVKSSRRVSPSFVREQSSGAGGMTSVRKSRRSSGLSAKARALVGKARRAGTVKAYRSGWNKFHSRCGERKINPVSCSVESIVNFLADQQSLVSFGTLAGYRSAISFYHDPVEGAPVGKHSLVSEVMKGAFRDNPPVPEFTNTWDVNVVLSYLQELGPNTCLSQKLLTLNLAMLLALVCRARGHELHAINPQAISWFDDKVGCHILGMTKTKIISKPKKVFAILKFPSIK